MNRYRHAIYSFLIIIVSLSLPTLALVRMNKGPAFKVRAEGKPRPSQDDLLLSYVPWAALNEGVNQTLRNSLRVRATFQSPISGENLLSPLDLDDNYLRFGYRDSAGKYGSWKFVETRYGYCHGMTLVTRQFLYLAKFRPDLRLKADYSWEKSPEKWLEFYKEAVDTIMSGKVAEIPGFKNLADFSHSPIQEYIQRHVADQWALNTLRMNMLINVYEKTFKPLDENDVTALKTKIQGFLKKGFYPRIILGPHLYDIEDPHVVMVTKLYKPSKAGCIHFQFFNVGTNSGGYFEDAEYCAGDYAWTPDDEHLFFKDIGFGLMK